MADEYGRSGYGRSGAGDDYDSGYNSKSRTDDYGRGEGGYNESGGDDYGRRSGGDGYDRSGGDDYGRGTGGGGYNKSGKDDYDGGYNKSGTNDDEYGRRGTGGGYNSKSSGDDAYTGGAGYNSKSSGDDDAYTGVGYNSKSSGDDAYTGGGYNRKSGGADDGEYGSSRDDDDSEMYRKEEKEHKHKEHLGEMGALAAGAFALYERHEAKKDPEHAQRHKIEEGVAAVAALGSGGFAFHEHHDKKEAKDAAEDAEEESGRGEGKKKHHFFGFAFHEHHPHASPTPSPCRFQIRVRPGQARAELRSRSPPSPPVAAAPTIPRDPPPGRPLTMEAMEELSELAESMRQAASLLADDDPSDDAAPRRPTTFLNAVALGNVGAGKSAVLNSLIGHPVLPTGENGATRAPIVVDLQREPGLSSKAIVLQIDSKSQQVSASALRHSLQDRLSKGASGGSGRGRADEIYLKLRTSTAPSLKLIDLPGIDQRAVDDSMINEYAGHNDAILLVVIPAMQAADVASSRALRLAKDIDSDGTRTVGVISKVDQANGDAKTIACVQALLSNKGPKNLPDIEWVALIGQSVALASAQSAGSENSLETAWRAEAESLKNILTGAPQNKLGRTALVDTIAKQIRKRMKVRVPNLLSGLQGKSQMVQDELARLGESMVQSPEGTRAVALELCREFEDKFLAHITSGEGSGWKIVASFEGKFPDRIKQLPLDRHFDLNNVKRIVLEADGYQPYLISPEKGLRSLIKIVLEMAKEPSRLCVEEVHRVLLDIVNASANATPGLGRYPPFKREVVAIASNALETFKNDAKKMVVALVDMERAFVPPQHFIRLVQRRMERQRREDELRNRSSKKTQDAEQSTSKRASSPQTDAEQGGGSLKSMKDKSGQQDKDAKEGSNLQVAGPAGEITAGYLLKKSAKTNGWSKRWFVLNEKSGKLGYTKKQEERHFRGVITLEECNLEEVEEEEPSKSSKDSKKANGSEKTPSLVFKITNRVAYKTVLKAHSAVVLKAESMADKVEWVNKIKAVIQSKGGSFKGPSTEGGSMRQSNSDGALDTMARRPADPEEELRWMSQEVRGYVEAVLSSLAANVPKAIVLCQVEKAKEDMLNQLYSSISGQSNVKIEELLQEDHNAKRRREKYQKQSSLLSKLTRQLSIHDNRASVSSYSNDTTEAESPRTPSRSGEDWRSAFDSASNGPVAASKNSESRSRSADGRSRRYENGDVSSGANSGSRRTPNRLPPAPPKY